MKRSGPVIGAIAASAGLAIWLAPGASASVASPQAPAATPATGVGTTNPPPPGSGITQSLTEAEQHLAALEQQNPALDRVLNPVISGIENLITAINHGVGVNNPPPPGS